ncbi:hypothetical protein GOODEAATRI_014827, partial [Goodea atripinnis]
CGFCFLDTTLLLPPDQPSLPNPWICQSESAFSYMTLFLYPGPRLKLLPRILLPLSALTALTQFMFPDHRNLLSHWVYKPKNLWDASQLLPCQHSHSEDLKIGFLVPLRILRRLVAFSLSLTSVIILSFLHSSH